MKPLERIFFMACINSWDYQLWGSRSIWGIIYTFEELGFSKKQLLYYLRKWIDNGFCDYNADTGLGTITIDKLCGEYKEIYESEVFKHGKSKSKD